MNPRFRRRWTEQPSEALCNICGWRGSHSNVCPFGPMPTGRRRSEPTGDAA